MIKFVLLIIMFSEHHKKILYVEASIYSQKCSGCL